VSAVPSVEPLSAAGEQLAHDVRDLPSPIGHRLVTGPSAQLVDSKDSLFGRMPLAALWIAVATFVLLFMMFGSVVVPAKAVVLNLLSLTATFGAMVWIFQDGNLSNLLNFVPLGYTIAGNPIIMFSVIFGLSMDYEVLLLSRIQESYRRTGDNTAAVAEGLSKTAGVITGAALIMVSVFAAFSLADVITIKSIGVGMAIAVAVDATIVRVLLVPATMRLMGKWNWWAPGVLGRFVDRLGFSHVEDEVDEGETGQPGEPGTKPATTPGLAGS
jgi:RND superfamily putative drug exporter